MRTHGLVRGYSWDALQRKDEFKRNAALSQTFHSSLHRDLITTVIQWRVHLARAKLSLPFSAVSFGVSRTCPIQCVHQIANRSIPSNDKSQNHKSRSAPAPYRSSSINAARKFQKVPTYKSLHSYRLHREVSGQKANTIIHVAVVPVQQRCGGVSGHRALCQGDKGDCSYRWRDR